MKNKSLWEIMIPKNIDKHTIFHVSSHRQWNKYVEELTGGMVFFSNLDRRWISSTKTSPYFDNKIPVRIFCSKEQMDKIIDFTMQHYDQKHVIAYELSNNIILKHNGNEINEKKI